MVRHTLQTLGPQGARDPDGARLRARRSTRPARRVARARSTAATPAREELAAWKAQVRAAWPSVRVDHVEATGVGDAPEVGSTLEVRAFVSLGEPRAGGRRGAGRATAGSTSTTGSPTRPRCRCATRRPTRAAGTGTSATVTLDRPGPFGYTARVVPHHRLVASPAELGLAVAAGRERRDGLRRPAVARLVDQDSPGGTDESWSLAAS